jgi:hypothetical protein
MAETQTLTLADFLLARFDGAYDREESRAFPRWAVLADLESKRDIVREHVGYGGTCGPCGGSGKGGGRGCSCDPFRSPDGGGQAAASAGDVRRDLGFVFGEAV